MNNSAFALIDCNNFFVACERLFRPGLEGRPVVVLSSNDGCAVSRSAEAKALGIPMGAPYFKFRELFARHGVVSFSANFELYGDISERITNLLTTITPRIEVYSVDESFLDLSALPITDYTGWGKSVRANVLKNIGIPVSIGITPTKTLSKLAADRAKKLPELGGVLSLIGETGGEINRYLRQVPVGDIWGVGWRLAPKLKAEGIHTAFDLKNLRPQRAGQLMGVHGRQMVAELGSTSCLPLQTRHKPQQQIMRGRQFGTDTSQFEVVEAAVASLIARAATHLRRERQLTRQAAVVIRTNRHKPGYRRIVQTVSFATPTADTGAIAAALIAALKGNWNSHLHYHKADVLLFDLVPVNAVQTDLLGAVRTADYDRAAARLQAADTLNRRYGNHTVRYAAEDLSDAWRPRHYLGSPRYTSSWSELPEAKLV